MAQVLPVEGQLRLQTDTCWIAGNSPLDPAGGGGNLILDAPRPNINISQMLNEWTILTSHHGAGSSPLFFEASSLNNCPLAAAALTARPGGAANDGQAGSYWPQAVANPGAGAVQPVTGGAIFLDVADATTLLLIAPAPMNITPGGLDQPLYSVTLQNKVLEIVNRTPPAGPPPAIAAFQALQLADLNALVMNSTATNMHQLIGEAFYYLKQVRDILGPNGWPKLAVEITGGKSRNYTRRKKRASAKRYK
jgi:hypothetical protein